MRSELREAIDLSRQGRTDEALAAFDQINPYNPLERLIHSTNQKNTIRLQAARKKKEEGNLLMAVGLEPKVLFSPSTLHKYLQSGGTFDGYAGVLKEDCHNQTAWRELVEVLEILGFTSYAETCCRQLDLIAPTGENNQFAGLQPLVTYLVPAFNESRDHARQTVESLLAQEGEPVRIVYVDDGSEEGTATADYMGGAFKREEANGQLIIVRQRNGGVSAARNEALNIARKTRAPYVAFLDAGDYALPHRTRVQRQYLEKNPNLGLIHARSDTIGDDGRPVHDHLAHQYFRWVWDNIQTGKCDPTSVFDLIGDIDKKLSIHAQTVMMTDDAIKAAGNQNIFWPRAQDWKYWVTAGLAGVQFGFIDQEVSRYRRVKRT